MQLTTCSICGELGETTEHSSYYHCNDSTVPTLDTVKCYYKRCSVCSSEYADMEISKKNMASMKVHKQRVKSISQRIIVDPHNSKQLFVNAPLAKGYNLSVTLISETVGDDTIVNGATPLWEVTIRKVGDPHNSKQFTLHNPSALGIVEFLTSMTDALCVDFLKKSKSDR